MLKKIIKSWKHPGARKDKIITCAALIILVVIRGFHANKIGLNFFYISIFYDLALILILGVFLTRLLLRD